MQHNVKQQEHRLRHPRRVEGTITFIRLAGFHDRTTYQFDSDWRQPIRCQNEMCEGGSLWLPDALAQMEERGLLVPGGEETFPCTGRERLAKGNTRMCIHGWRLAITSIDSE